MRPRHLRFEGLRSYTRAAEIDFADLDCFAIIGDTGAGKSTILEAICIALYGRPSWSTRNDVLIADGEKQFQVEFAFDIDGATWQVTRTRKRSGTGENKLTGPTPADSVDGAREVTAAITELLGLDADQFTRAVVLPQGRFDALLVATPGERNKMLKSLLGVGELSAVDRAARQIRSTWSDRTAAVEGARSQLPVDPAAALAESERERDLAAADIDALDAAIETAETHALAATESARTVDRLRAGLDTLRALDIDAAVDRIAEIDTLATVLRDRNAELRRARDAAAEAQSAAEADAAAALEGFDDRDTAISAEQVLRRAAEHLPAAQAALAEVEGERDDLGPRPTPPPALTEAENTLATADGALEAATTELAAVRRRHDDAVATIERLTMAAAAVVSAADAVDLAETAAADARTEVERRAESDALAATAVGAARLAVDAAQRSHAAVAAATGHGPGDPCPVCARDLPDGWSAPMAADLDDARAALADAEAAAADAATRHRAASDDLARAEARLDAAKADHTRCETERDELADTARALGCALDGADPLAPLAGLVADAESTLASCQAERAETAAQVDHLREAHRDAVAAWEAATKSIDQRIADRQHAVAALTDPIESLPAAWRPGDDTDLAEMADAIAAACATEQAARQRASAAAQDVAAASAALTDLLEERDITVMRPARAAAAVIERAAVATAALAARDPQAVPDIAETDHVAVLCDVAASVRDEAHAAVQEAQVQCDAATQAVADAEQAIATALGPTECATLDEARDRRTRRTADRDHAVRAVATASQVVDDAARLDRYLAVARPVLAAVEVVVKSLGNGQFVDHVIAAREQELLAEASRRLRAISHDEHGFVDDFGVVSLHSGETRPPDALSGGERFQASLALALALVEIASRGSGRLESIFVDEGFGSLDTESLRGALDTLFTVAGAGKQVGVISHLRAVAEGVDDVFHVVKDRTTGSRITHLGPEARDALLADEGAGLL